LTAEKTLGEREIIQLLLEKFQPSPMPIPSGDDVSAVDLGGGRLAVLKVDMLVGKTDMPPGMTAYQAARKAVVMAVSDFAAKGVRPRAALVGLGLPRYGSRKVKSLAEGLRDAARQYGLSLIGGDTNEAGDLVITVAALGFCGKGRLLLRGGAKPGDLLAVTGPFGRTAAGLKILLENLKAPGNLREKLLRPVFTPEARLQVGLRLRRLGATAAIDSSDGLAWSLRELAVASGVGFSVHRLPLAPEAKAFADLHRLDPFDLTFYGGEEYELVVTLDPRRFRRGWEKRWGLQVIGRAVEQGGLVFEEKDVRRTIQPRGWEHFKARRRGRKLA
jgi:thiamine-monophosphate kinase